MGPYRAALALLPLLVATGCAGQVPLHRGHFIMVHEDGYPIDFILSDGRRFAGDEINLRSPEVKLDRVSDQDFVTRDVEEILRGIDEYARKDPPPGHRRRLIIFAHGGLNPYSNGLKRVEQFVGPKGEGAKFPGISTAYWVFINWNSDLLGSLADDLCCIRRGDRDLLGGLLTAPFVGAAHVAASGLLAPRAWWYQGENAVDGFAGPGGVRGDICDVPVREGEDRPLEPEKIASYFLLYPLRALSAAVIQAFGTPAWDQMKRRAALVAARIREITEKGTVREGAGHILLRKLQGRVVADGKWKIGNDVKDLEIFLVGHSMGAIVLSRLLEQFPEMPVSRIVFLGAASSLQDFDGAVVPYLRRHAAAKFWGFSLSEIDEAREISGLDVYERGSLLVWIDNLFERVNVPGQRTFGRAQNLRRHFSVPDGLGQRVFLLRFDGRGRDDPRRHGDFDSPKIVSRVLGLAEQDACPGR
jgi:hypothetical protein